MAVHHSTAFPRYPEFRWDLKWPNDKATKAARKDADFGFYETTVFEAYTFLMSYGERDYYGRDPGGCVTTVFLSGTPSPIPDVIYETYIGSRYDDTVRPQHVSVRFGGAPIARLEELFNIRVHTIRLAAPGWWHGKARLIGGSLLDALLIAENFGSVAPPGNYHMSIW